jgi:hypothetical protein
VFHLLDERRGERDAISLLALGDGGTEPLEPVMVVKQAQRLAQDGVDIGIQSGVHLLPNQTSELGIEVDVHGDALLI